MENRTDKNTYTLPICCGNGSVSWCFIGIYFVNFGTQYQNKQGIRKTAKHPLCYGCNENDESSAVFVSTDKVESLFKEYITKQLEVQDGDVMENDQAFLIDVKKEQANAKSGKVRKLPVFIGEKDGKTYHIVPIRGKGLWDAIWGYVAMDDQMVIQGAIFDHKGETPGLGANIKQRFFMDDFVRGTFVRCFW